MRSLSAYWSFIFLVSYLGLIGCDHQETRAKTVSGNHEKLISALSVYVLRADQYREFVVGRPQDELLKSIAGKGLFVQSGIVEGHTVTAFMYSLFGDAYSDHCVLVWALFKDREFWKFVECPDLVGDKPPRIGDLSRLLQAAKSSAVRIEELQQDNDVTASAVDVGLTGAWLLFGGKIQATEARVKAAMAPQYQRNEQLRKQFDATRLRIGMTAQDVALVYRARPLDTGNIDDRHYQVYGSTESLIEAVEHDSYLYYQNVLVVFEGGKVVSIYGVPGGKDSLRQIREMFAGLPPVARNAQ